MTDELTPPGRYDWGTLLNGEEHTLRQGEDFKGTPRSAQTFANRKAREAGLVLVTKTTADTIRLRVLGPREATS